jgi:V/A-type H+-transporting ATPase subunit C
MASLLLKSNDYIALAQMESLNDIARYLIDHSSYAEELAAVDMTAITRSRLEQLFDENIHRIYLKLYKFSYGQIHKFIGALMRIYEVKFILKCVSYLNLNYNLDDNKILLNYIVTKKDDFAKLLTAKSFKDIADALTTTPYYKVIHDFTAEDSNIDMIKLESLLYNVYYDEIYKVYPKDKNSIVAIKILIENIIRILRFKFNFNLPPEKIYPYLVSTFGVVNEKRLIELCNMNDAEMTLFISQKIKLNDNTGNITDLVTSKHINNFLYKRFKYMFADRPPSFETSFAFISLKEIEINNLIHIVEGVRYHTSRDIILGYIVGLDIEEVG